MPCLRDLARAVIVAGAATAIMFAPAALTGQMMVLANAPGVTGNGGPDGNGGGGGCGSGPGWHGCGGWNPAQGGFGSGCFNGICGGWDGSRGWGS